MKANIGAFCQTYGNTIENRIIEFLIESQDLDIAVGDMARELKISRPKAYSVINDFKRKGYVMETRVISKTQLYTLNKKNERVKLFLRDFKECLRIIAGENDGGSISGTTSIPAVSAKNAR